MGQTLSVLVADDHPPTRAGIRVALEAGGLAVCAEAPTAQAAVQEALVHAPDVCLLDIHMPGGGVNAAAEITAKLPDSAVVMLTVSRDDDDLFAALRAGAAGYLLKDIQPDRLPDELRAVLRGEAAMPRALVTRLMDEFRARGSRRLTVPGGHPVQLTAREWEVLEGMREGLSTAALADRMHVAPVTVRTHVAAILRKLRVTSRDEAVRLVDGA